MTANTASPPHATLGIFWRLAAAVGLVATAVLLLGLSVRPTLALHILWDMVIPLLPVTFLVNPMIWRNVCPLATLNTLTGRRTGRRIPERGLLGGAWIAGLLLLAILVPARRFLFNENGIALLVTIAVVATLALLMGTAFSRRSGFCNAICPVLPVEKLYGQAPLLPIPTARCPDCNHCSAVGCLDLAGGKSLPQSLGPLRRTTTWPRSPLAVFAGAFPGFIVGYFTTENGPLSSAPAIFGHIGLWALGSLAVVRICIQVFHLGWRETLPVLGGAAVGIYYWFAAPALATAYGVPEPGGAILRVALLSLTAAWLIRALRRSTDAVPARIPATRGPRWGS